MPSSFIHDPIGIAYFTEQTPVTVSTGCAESTVTVRVLPFSARDDSRDGETVFWVGADTYIVDDDAAFTVVDPDEVNPHEQQPATGSPASAHSP